MKYQANKRILFKSNFVPFFLLIIIAFCARKDFEHFLAVINIVPTSVLLTLVENKLLNMLNHTYGHVFTVLAQKCCNSVEQHYFN